MGSRLFLQVIVAIAAIGLAVPARAQEVLYITDGTRFVFAAICPALDALGLPYSSADHPDEALDMLRSQEWDLVIVRSLTLLVLQTAILTELEVHVDRGGLLHVQVADLENASDRQYQLLGLEGAQNLSLPLSELKAPLPVHSSVPGIGLLTLWDETYPPDYGDALIPSSEAYFTQWYADTRLPATVISSNGSVLVNGPQWDNWAPGDTSAFVARQIAWMLSCKADLDGDGDLTVFDFLEFQNLFDAGDVRADVFYDGRLDIFDFLEFLNMFQAGC